MGDFADTRVSLAGQGLLVGRTVSEVSNQIVNVDINGVVAPVRVVAGLTLDPGAVVLVTRYGSARWVSALIVQGAPLPDEPDSDPPPAPKPSVTTGTLVCEPIQTASFRNGVWRTDGHPVNSFDVYQGRFHSSAFGRQTGCAFYGTRPRSIAGAQVTRASIRVRRLRAGSFAARTSTLWLLSQHTRPSGAPTRNESMNGPRLAVDQTNSDFVIPNSWAQAMVNGTRGGLAVHINADEPYMRFAGRGSISWAWTLTIRWRREN